MKAYRQMFCLWARVMRGGKSNASLIVFKGSAIDRWGALVNRKPIRLQLLKKVNNSNDLLKCCRQGNVFGFSGAQRNERLHCRLPEYGTSSISDDEASA